MRTAAGLEVEIRLRYAQVMEKSLGHRIVVMLPRMDNSAVNSSMLQRFTVNGRYFHKVGPRPGDKKNF